MGVVRRPRPAFAQLKWGLLRASTVRDLAQSAVGFATGELGFSSAFLAWSASGTGDDLRHVSIEPEGALAPEASELIKQSLAFRALAPIRVGETMAVRVCGAASGGWVVLVAESGGPNAIEDSARFKRFIKLVAARAPSVLETERLRFRVARLESAERLQRALYAIADLASSELEMSEVLQGIHEIVGRLMYAENFFIVLHDDVRKTLRFAYFADSADPDAPDPAQEIPLAQMQNSLTLATIRLGRSLMGPSARLIQELGLASRDEMGPDSEDWLGVPLLAGGTVRGAVVVQSYDPTMRFSEEDRALLGYVAQHILTALEHKQAQEELEHRVEQRTRELVAEVRERERGEKLQRALFRIAELTGSTDGLTEFYAAIHAIVGELLYAENFFIALLSEDGTELRFPYGVDEQGDVFVSRKLGSGMTEYVLRHGQPLRASPEESAALIASGEVHRIGPMSACWLGVPLISHERTVGALVVQSYTPGVVYSRADQDLLTFVCLHIANALERKHAQDSVRSANVELSATLQRLRQTQHQLVEAEKMASLGGLVAGVAHEINTPLGISLTAASHLAEEAHRLRGKLAAGELRRSELEAFEHIATEATDLIVRNLKRASELVRSFKQVAVDQTLDEPRKVELGSAIRDILTMLAPALRRTPHRVELECPEPIELTLPAGALYQIVSNLVMNAIQHAFPHGRSGRVVVGVKRTANQIALSCCDDGVGMSEAVRAQIFDPFFTTRRGEGGTGLGLHILYNLVAQVLRGSVRCDSVPEQGSRFEVRWAA
jgi:signal transduction histidine kinase